jgi:hypothetical protein
MHISHGAGDIDEIIGDTTFKFVIDMEISIFLIQQFIAADL